jgi:hypothetical protein
MAKRNRNRGNEGSETEENTEGGKSVPKAPEGFNLNVGRDRGDGWAKKEDGNTIQGRLLGRHSYKNKAGKERFYYQVKVVIPVKAVIPNPDDDEADDIEGELPAGSVINVDETAKLSDLAPYCKDGGTYDVWFAYGDKIDIGGGQTMWTVYGPKLAVISKPGELP